jgi:hypothetical protein
MPQHLIKVSAAYAKSHFGVVIADNPPLAEVEREMTQTPSPKRVVVKTGGGTLPLDRDGDPNDLDDQHAPKHDDLF